jgi:hypothetical protein
MKLNGYTHGMGDESHHGWHKSERCQAGGDVPCLVRASKALMRGSKPFSPTAPCF